MEKTGAYLCGLLCAAGRIELNKDEYDKIMEQLLETNMREFGRIVEKIGKSESFSEKPVSGLGWKRKERISGWSSAE